MSNHSEQNANVMYKVHLIEWNVTKIALHEQK